MADVVKPEKRSEMMSGIRGKDTKPEIIIRKSLHRLGFRYRIHGNDLPGRPDLVFPRYHAVIFVNGCFWHHHQCHLFKWPSTRKEFWHKKITANEKRDSRNLSTLLKLGWRVLIVWECTLKGKHRLPLEYVINQISSWLLSDSDFMELETNEQSSCA